MKIGCAQLHISLNTPHPTPIVPTHVLDTVHPTLLLSTAAWPPHPSVGSLWPSASSPHPPAPSVSSCSSPAPPACSSPLSICWPNLFGRGGGKDGGQRDSAKSNSAVEQNKTNPIHVGVVESYCGEYSIFLPHFPLGHTCTCHKQNSSYQAICENNQSTCTSHDAPVDTNHHTHTHIL